MYSVESGMDVQPRIHGSCPETGIPKLMGTLNCRKRYFATIATYPLGRWMTKIGGDSCLRPQYA